MPAAVWATVGRCAAVDLALLRSIVPNQLTEQNPVRLNKMIT